MSDKYTWDNAGDLEQLSMNQTLSKDIREPKQTDEAAANLFRRTQGQVNSVGP